ncbi:hypothetical protein TNCV_1340021 [Trichonephila clavipes]|uniref:Uncharacterized protein n=1 Tax=Trichonephila clavipes TaxID=2585209 RepID=A0A8X6R6H1_TRICX|nr:hypothetical protein TNCV_1340021 [Trichonephila clavipes]
MGGQKFRPFFPMPVRKLKETSVQCAFVFSRIWDDSASEEIELTMCAQENSRHMRWMDKRSMGGVSEASLSDRLASQQYLSLRIKTDFESRRFRISNRMEDIEPALARNSLDMACFGCRIRHVGPALGLHYPQISHHGFFFPTRTSQEIGVLRSSDNTNRLC